MQLYISFQHEVRSENTCAVDMLDPSVKTGMTFKIHVGYHAHSTTQFINIIIHNPGHIIMMYKLIRSP